MHFIEIINEGGCVKTVADNIEKIRCYLDKSWVLGTLRMSYVCIWENNEIRSIGKEAVPDQIFKYLNDCFSSDSEIETGHKEIIVDAETARVFDIYFIRINNSTCLVTVFDLTEVLKAERLCEERETQIYRDVIRAVTQGRLLLARHNEIGQYLDERAFHSGMEISRPHDVSKVRHLVRKALEGLSMSKQRKDRMVLCVSEAATNVIKHVGEGEVRIYIGNNNIRTVISDEGPGIDVSRLPQLTLMKGFSTKISLGYGFNIMLDFLDHLIMSTSKGTTLVMEMNCSADDEKGYQECQNSEGEGFARVQVG